MISINTDTLKKYGSDIAILASALEKYYYYDDNICYRDNFFENLPASKERLFKINTFEKLQEILGTEIPIVRTFKKMEELGILEYKIEGPLNWHSNLIVFLDTSKI